MEEAEIYRAVQRQRWIGRIDYQVFEKLMVNQFVAWLNSTVWMKGE
jgi:hypothetical protein